MHLERVLFACADFSINRDCVIDKDALRFVWRRPREKDLCAAPGQGKESARRRRDCSGGGQDLHIIVIQTEAVDADDFLNDMLLIKLMI